MKVESSSKLWTVLFTAILLGIVAYFGYKFYFPKEEVLEVYEEAAPSPTTAPFNWDLYLDDEEATPEAEPAKDKTMGQEETTSTTTTTKTQPVQAVTKTTETTITTTTTTNVDGEETTESQTYTTNDGNINVEVKAEAHSEASN